MFARRQSKVNERSQWVQMRLAESKTDFQTVIDQRTNTAKTLALRAVREWIRSRQSELRTSIRELNAQMQRDQQARQQHVAEAQTRVQEIERVIQACERYIVRLAPTGAR